MSFLALLNSVVVETSYYTTRTRVSQANPVDGIAVLDFLSINMPVEPEIEATAAIWQ